MTQLHPQMLVALEGYEKALSDAGLSDIYSKGVEPARRFLAEAAAPEEQRPPIFRRETRDVPGPASNIPVQVYYPDDRPGLPILVWFHGGGWVLGDLDFADYNCRQLANDAGCAVVSVHYRLAPETQFPGAIDDCFAVTTWVAESGETLGIDPTRIAVGGDSAGGNLAACVAYRARQTDLSLALQLLVYPVIDADFSRPSYESFAEGYQLTRAAMQWFWDCYVPEDGDRTHPAVSPLHAADLAGLPPAAVLTAECDTLRDEGEAYAEAMANAGVAVELKRFDGMLHGFFNTLTEQPVDEIAAASAMAANALRQAFGTV